MLSSPNWYFWPCWQWGCLFSFNYLLQTLRLLYAFGAAICYNKIGTATEAWILTGYVKKLVFPILFQNILIGFIHHIRSDWKLTSLSTVPAGSHGWVLGGEMVCDPFLSLLATNCLGCQWVRRRWFSLLTFRTWGLPWELTIQMQQHWACDPSWAAGKVTPCYP